MTANRVRPGDVVHVVEPITIAFRAGIFGDSEVLGRGRTLTLTAELIASNPDSHGDGSIFDLAGKPAEQERRWGKVCLASGPWPSDQPTWRHGDQVWAEARANAIAAAWDMRDEHARNEALAQARAKFGPAPTSKTTLVRRVD